jgi:hypothetical protein
MASDQARANESADAPDLANRLLEHCARGGVALGHRPSPDRVSFLSRQ